MDLYQTFIILVLIACSIYTSYTDAKYKKIKNIASLGLIGFGILNHIIYFLIGGVEAEQHLVPNLSIIFWGGLFGIMLYFLGVWSAGDAKLFWGFSVAAPPMLFRSIPASGIPLPIIMLINIFLVYLLFILPSILLKTSREEKRVAFLENIKSMEVFKNTLKRVFVDFPFFLLILYSSTGLVSHFLTPRGMYINGFVQGIAIIVFLVWLNGFITKKGLDIYKNLIVLLICCVGLFFIPVFRERCIVLGPIVFVVFFLRSFISDLGAKVFVKETNLRSLTKGVIPAERITQTATPDGQIQYEKESAIFPRRKKHNVILDVSSRGMSENEIREIQALSKNSTFQDIADTIKIQQHCSLAVFICLGGLLTILCKEILINYLLYLWGSLLG